jgi:hypothetical protein
VPRAHALTIHAMIARKATSRTKTNPSAIILPRPP